MIRFEDGPYVEDSMAIVHGRGMMIGHYDEPMRVEVSTKSSEARLSFLEA